MYARLTRFEGGEPEVLRQELEQMREQMQAGLTDEAIDQTASSVEGRFERDEVGRLLNSIKRTIVLADVDAGASAMLFFCETEDEARRVHELFDAMSPGDEGGKRVSVDIYEVAADQTFG